MRRDAKSGQRRCRSLSAALSLGVGVAGTACSIPITRPIAPTVEVPADAVCAEWAEQAFVAPSPTRDEAFIDCLVKRDPSVTTDELRHKLETGTGEGLLDRLMSGEARPISSTPDCPFLRVAVESPAGTDDEFQKPMRDLFSTALARAGFEVVDPSSTHQWWASSLALDTGADTAAWTLLVRAVPEIGNGQIQFTSIRKTVSGQEGSFSGMQTLRAFPKDQAPEAARLAAEATARELLPAARRRCDDIDATLEEARMQLEQLRSELTAEIDRVRREKARRSEASRHKQLEIEVEG